MYVVCILFIFIALPITCFKLRGCLWYELRKEQVVRILLRQKLWESKNPDEAAKRADAAERAEEARAAAKSSRGVTFRRGDAVEPSSSALVAPVPPPARPPPQPMRQLPPPPPPPPAASYSADMEAGAPPAPAPAKGGAFARMRNAFGGGGPRPAARMQTPIGGGDAAPGRGAAPAAAAHDDYTDDDDYSGSEYTESTFTGVTQSQTATSVGASLPPVRPAGRK